MKSIKNHRTSSKKFVLKNKKRFFGFIMFVCIIVFTLIYTQSAMGFKEQQYQSVAVNSGDTLWSIAQKYNKGSNIRQYINEIKEINNLDSSLICDNSTIIIPVDE
jgi:sensor histidine kinase regulating citrate/malate metabolism